MLLYVCSVHREGSDENQLYTEQTPSLNIKITNYNDNYNDYNYNASIKTCDAE